MNATKLCLHFGRFAGDAVLSSNIFCICIVFRCLISFMKYNYFVFRVELNLEWCVFTCIFQIERKLNFAKMSVTTLLLTLDGIFCKPCELAHMGRNKGPSDQLSSKIGEGPRNFKTKDPNGI